MEQKCTLLAPVRLNKGSDEPIPLTCEAVALLLILPCHLLLAAAALALYKINQQLVASTGADHHVCLSGYITQVAWQTVCADGMDAV